MELKQVVFMSQESAECFVPDEHWAIVSIRCPGDEVQLEDGWAKSLYLEFDDIESFYSGYTRFVYKQADQIIDFLGECVKSETVDCLAVHCSAGISRSAAVALFACEKFAPDLIPMRIGTERHNTLVLQMLNRRFDKKNGV